MKHQPDHDPILDYHRCSLCYTALSATFAKMGDLDLGPKDTDTLIRKLREIAAEQMRLMT